MTQALAKTAPKSALSFEDKMKQLLRTLAQKVSTDLPVPQLTMTYQAIADWLENMEALKENVRDRLLKLAVERGTQVSDAGSKRAIVDGYVLEARIGGAVWDEGRVRALLAGKQLPLDKWMTVEVKHKVDETKLGVLVELGKLTEAEVSTCKKERRYSLQPPHALADEEEAED